MLVDEQYQRNVGYVVADYLDESTGISSPWRIGTFFIVEQRVGRHNDLGVVQYAVTCRHILEEVRDDHHYGAISLRINNRHLRAEDFPCDIDTWVLSDTTDLPVALIDLPPKFLYWPYPMARPLSVQRILPGHPVFIIGLFSLLPGFGSVDAVVRHGTIARFSQRVPIRINPHSDATTDVRAYLIESMSWGGESGSPVFVYDEHMRGSNPGALYETSGGLYEIESLQKNDITASEVSPWLLGVLHGDYRMPV